MNYLRNRPIPQWLFFGGLITCAIIALCLLVYMIESNYERSRANAIIEAKITESQRLAEQGQFDEAIRLMENAAKERSATNTDRALQTLQRLQSERDAALKTNKLNEAKRLVEERKIPQALAALAEYDVMPGTADDGYAGQLHITCQALSSERMTVEYLVELSEDEFSSLMSGKAPTAMNRLTDACGMSIMARLRQSAGAAQEGRKNAREFRRWVDYRKYEDPSTRRIFDSYFTSFMDILERESITETHRRELNKVRELFTTQGFGAFLVHFEKALLEVYNADNFRAVDDVEVREAELRAALDRNKGEIVKDIIDAVARAIPPR